MKPAFRADGTVTAGNSFALNDGASMLFIGGEHTVLDVEPLARITGRASFGNDPDMFGIAPVDAANRALARAGRTWAGVDLVELNEAFAAQSLACLRLWTELDPRNSTCTVERWRSGIRSVPLAVALSATSPMNLSGEAAVSA